MSLKTSDVMLIKASNGGFKKVKFARCAPTSTTFANATIGSKLTGELGTSTKEGSYRLTTVCVVGEKVIDQVTDSHKELDHSSVTGFRVVATVEKIRFLIVEEVTP